MSDHSGQKTDTEHYVVVAAKIRERLAVNKQGSHKFRMENAVFWAVTQCGSCNNQRFGGVWRLHHQNDKNL
jgi:hypothetical protein